MRAPYQVLVIPYYKDQEDYKFAIFNRSDMVCWQWISGGGEDFDNSILESAKRESNEEAGLPLGLDYIVLDTITPIPSYIFGDFIWGKDVFVVPEYAFGVHVKDTDILLSKEHDTYKWVSYQEALELLKYDSNKTALWELVTRLERQS